MFLNVPANMSVMEPNEPQREDLARRLADFRRVRHDGNKQSAYIAAGVNSATWGKLENALPVAESSLVKVVKHIWPESRGDWERIKPPLGVDESTLADRIAEVESSDLNDETKAYILQGLRADLDAQRGSA